MQVFLPQAADFLHRKLAERQNRRTGILCPDTMQVERQALRQTLAGCLQDDFKDWQTAPLILTGHQPIFYPPGILIKDLLADALARHSGGMAVNLVVDTDEAEIGIEFPVPDHRTADGWTARKERARLNDPAGVLHAQKASHQVLADFLAKVQGGIDGLGELFDPERAQEIAGHMERLCRCVQEAETVVDGPIRFREEWVRARGMSVATVRATQLVSTSAFAYFTRFIVQRSADFRARYNEALATYRRDHGIRNPAQPLPDLRTGELPFWVQRGEKRDPLRDQDADQLDQALTEGRILPRAVTLTLFTRLFMCDLFIHGRGGARYDVITDRLLDDFFECKGAPFTVASATLRMEPRSEYPLAGRDLADIQSDIRAVRFDPTRFLDPTHPLSVQKRALTEARLEPGADLRALHQGMMDLNKQVRAELGDISERLTAERAAWEVTNKNRQVFFDRGLPFFFYDVQPLFEAVASYAEPAQPAERPVTEAG